MAEVITRFKLETTQFDSKLRDAAKELRDVAKEAERGGKDFNNFSQKSVEAARSLGNVASGAKNTKDRVKDLVGAYNEAAKAYNSLTQAQQQSDFGKALAQSIGQLKDRISEAKQELYGLNDAMGKAGGGLFSGLGDKMTGMMQVFGGNLMTKAAGWAASFASEMGQAVQQGIELARQGEGIRNAFERLGRGDILDGLREATHGTVTDLELMKAAVKFNDFNLPLEELGTMLAFAQQKAKDTGQSVDYMVDSIVTGLGRKSLMILDNLGLSATQIKDKMAETGDMTKAVGEIIREQMANAGEYIETAADRAAQADVELKNAMEELGRTLLPLEEQGTSMWKSLETGAINLLNEGVRPLVPVVIELKDNIAELYNTVANSSVFSGMVNWMEAAIDAATRYIPLLSTIRSLMPDGNNVASGAGIAGVLGKVAGGGNQLPNVTVTPPKISGGGGRRGGGRTGRTTHTPKVETPLPVGSVAALNKELSELRKQQELATSTEKLDEYQAKIDSVTSRMKVLKGEIPDPSKIQQGKGQSVLGIGIGQAELDSVQKQLNAMVPDGGVKIPAKIEINTQPLEDVTKKGKDVNKAFSAAAQAVSSIGDAFASIEDPSAKAAGMVMQAIASIALGFAQAAAAKDTTASGWAWLGWLAAGAAAMATTISTIHSLTGFENGGEIKGNSYSGDNIPIMANAGEVVLTRAMAGNIASQLQGSGSNVHVTGELRGESIYLAVNRSLKRRGKGELVTWK